MVRDLKVYRTLVWDNRRWNGFEFRPDDIIISTPPKSGTTWTQMLCAMLVFGGDKFSETMDNMSPWLDMNTRNRDVVFDLLASQQHRRFIKTHTPLDGLPDHPDVTYVIVGRDPRDVAISMEHHFANMDFDSFIATRGEAVGNDDLGDFPPPPDPDLSPEERMRQFVEGDAGITTLGSVVGHLHDAWAKRNNSNVALFHYRDYQHDLPEELRRLAKVLGTELDDKTADAFAGRAELTKMRARAEELAPDTGRSHWLDTSRFFRSGGRGEWADRFDKKLTDRYAERLAELSQGDADFVNWIHEGRINGGVELPR